MIQTKRQPVWWCTECSEPQYLYGTPCSNCGTAYVASWRCTLCKTINTGFRCSTDGCKNDKGKSLRGSRLATLLAGELPNGQSVEKRLYNFIMYTAYKRHIPNEVAIEAWGIALERLLRGINSYDPLKGKFLHWAMRVCRNALLNAARDDAALNKPLLSLDGVADGDDDDDTKSLAMIIIGDVLSIDTLIMREDMKKMLDTQIAIARREFGTYLKWTNGELVSADVFDACIDAIIETDGRCWQEVVSKTTGLEDYTIARRKKQAYEAWQRWQERRS